MKTHATPSGPAAAATGDSRLRILYSFPHRMGGQRICSTAWHQVSSASAAGAEVTVLTGSLARALPPGIRAHTTLSLGRWRAPNRVFGTDALCRFHDLLTSRWLHRHHRQVDLVHGWPLASLRTIQTARRYGVPVVLERPNAHTRYAYAAVAAESTRLGVQLVAGSEHVFNSRRLAHEESEYLSTDYLLCPSDFVRKTFVEAGVPPGKLLRHQYGCDTTIFHARGAADSSDACGLVVLHAGIGTPRKGLHHALTAWLESGAQKRGTFLVCGELAPEYRRRIEPMLSHPSVHLLGQRTDLGDVMRRSHVFTLPTVEEGSALVTYEARACGCVLAVSDASGAVCTHLENALVHRVGDVSSLTRHFQTLDRDRNLLRSLRDRSLATIDGLTWEAAGQCLVSAYRSAARATR